MIPGLIAIRERPFARPFGPSYNVSQEVRTVGRP
jgi:hypothetical protein